jgi:hypothetical protein
VAGDLDSIAWGQTQNGLRIGLSPPTLNASADQTDLAVTIWFENTGKEFAPDVQVQAWDELLSFSGSKAGNAFAVEYRGGVRTAWPPPDLAVAGSSPVIHRMPLGLNRCQEAFLCLSCLRSGQALN